VTILWPPPPGDPTGVGWELTTALHLAPGVRARGRRYSLWHDGRRVAHGLTGEQARKLMGLAERLEARRAREGSPSAT
jgi:hypothetical protein